MYAGAEARPTPILLRRPFASFSDAMQALGFDGTSNFTPHWSAQGLGHPKTGMATLEALVAALEVSSFGHRPRLVRTPMRDSLADVRPVRRCWLNGSGAIVVPGYEQLATSANLVHPPHGCLASR